VPFAIEIIADLHGPDCNRNQTPDSCDIAGGLSADIDGNGLPDECQQSRPRRPSGRQLTSS
jgi:hypothetical protein